MLKSGTKHSFDIFLLYITTALQYYITTPLQHYSRVLLVDYYSQIIFSNRFEYAEGIFWLQTYYCCYS